MTSAEISSGIGVRDLLILRLIPPQCLPAKGANGLFAANRSLIPRCSLGIALQWPRMSPLALGGRERASVRRLHSKMNGLGPNGACPFWAAFFFVNAHRGSIWFLSVLSDFRRTKKVLDVRTTRLRRTQHRLSSARLVIAHKSFDPPCDHLARKTLPRPPHPLPSVCDDRETPLCGPGRDWV